MDDDKDQKSIFEKITDTVKDIASSAMDAAKPTVQPATGERTVASTAGEGAVTDPSPLSTATMPRNSRPAGSEGPVKKKPGKLTAKSAKKSPAKAKRSAKRSTAKKSGAKKSTRKKGIGKANKVSKKNVKKSAKKSVTKSKTASKTTKRKAGPASKKRKTKKSRR